MHAGQYLLRFSCIPEPGKAAILAQGMDDRRRAAPLDRQAIDGPITGRKAPAGEPARPA